jgi:ribonuclease-3
MMKKELKTVLEKLNIEAVNMELYLQALTHSSFVHERGLGAIAHNERLEFLGDAVLELAISEVLYLRFPQFPEGKLTRYRAGMVCEESLARLAVELDLGSYLRLGKGEAASGGRQRPSILADALEALLGTIYLDLGFSTVRRVVEELFAGLFADLSQGCLRMDYKTMMQEFAQARLGVTPEYRIIAESGPDHSKEFIAQFELNQDVHGQGRGRSKKEAEQEAARDAYERLLKNK